MKPIYVWVCGVRLMALRDVGVYYTKGCKFLNKKEPLIRISMINGDSQLHFSKPNSSGKSWDCNLTNVEWALYHWMIKLRPQLDWAW